jgi:hypothetical protein
VGEYVAAFFYKTLHQNDEGFFVWNNLYVFWPILKDQVQKLGIMHKD